jgi:hypothetical protein
MNTQKRTTCGADGCYLPRMSWSAYCGMHSHRSQRHGHPGIRSGVRESDLKPYAHRIDRMMTLYGNNRATQVALQIAGEILIYKLLLPARSPWTMQGQCACRGHAAGAYRDEAGAAADVRQALGSCAAASAWVCVSRVVVQVRAWHARARADGRGQATRTAARADGL